jgi:acetyl-CoA carboxylase, biotin carboxylase subunit
MKRVLVANRGEIAMRVIRAAHDLGLEAVAVHSTPDAGAPHVRMADAAVEIGPGPAGKSYLSIDRLLAAAESSGADAVHPGYGFLAEREDFAAAIEAAGLAYVGPKPEHIALMGDKARARAAAERAGAPTIPGSDGAVSGEEAAALADEIGLPVALKAAGGGGGRGIRIVHDRSELRAQYAVASREAQGAFDDPRIYVERFVVPARHIEVQVLGDGEGTCVHLYERECSLQRRRQKVVEEAPAPGLAQEVREGLCAAAVAIGEAIGYRSAGTVEFLVDAQTGAFYFIEMNTRIQVEHPITEVTTGVDLVAAQLHLAAGEGLGVTQADVAPRGCAIELRINAEDPARGFLPSPGTIERVVLPTGPWVRLDTWLEPGGKVPPFYDSLLGKLVVWGHDRPTTLARTRRALRELEIEGVATTVPLLAELLEADWFAAGEFDTGTLEAWLDEATREVAG